MTNKGLQIGNYIKRNGLVVKVDEQTFWDIKNNPEQYEYIELTEEWLLRLGFSHFFKSIKGQDFYSLYINNKSKIYVNINTEKINIASDGLGIILSIEGIYIHQLQNLYFALTGEELEFKQS